MGTLDNSSWCYISVRQPGEYRDARIGHSVRHENLLAHRIVGDAARVTDAGSRGSVRRAAKNSQRGGVALSRASIDRNRMLLRACGPDFVILDVDEQPDR